MSIQHVNMISNRLSLRSPQRESLEILQRLCEIVTLEKEGDVEAALKVIQSEFSHLENFERDFPSLCFALATGFGKTRLLNEATASIELSGGANIERAVVRLPVAEMGQGVQTVILQMSAEALGLPVEIIELGLVDTADAPSAGAASASRLVLMGGNAIKGAAEEALTRWSDEERPAVGAYTFHAPPTEDLDPITGQGTAAFALAYLAQGVEIEVDEETGHIFVRRLISAHDVGKAINPQLVEGQIEGGAIQGLGWAIMENFISQQGMVLTPNFSTYLIPTIADIPVEFESIILESALDIGPWGATGVGEMSLTAVAPAIVDAVHDATGNWLNRLPLTPEQLYWSINEMEQPKR